MVVSLKSTKNWEYKAQIEQNIYLSKDRIGSFFPPFPFLGNSFQPAPIMTGLGKILNIIGAGLGRKN